MELYYIPKQDYASLNRILFQEFLKNDTYNFVQKVTGYLGNLPATNVVSNNLVSALLTIVTDNLTRFVVNKNPLDLIEGMSNGTLPMHMEIGHRHYINLVSEDIANNVINPAAELGVLRELSGLFSEIYLRNKTEMDEAILNLFTVLYNNLGHLSIRTYRTVVVPGNVLGVLIARLEDENCFTYG